MIVTGIGSRDISRGDWKMLNRVAKGLAQKGWHLRSGGARGADDAWEKGFLGTGCMTIYLPDTEFNGRRANGACYLAPVYDHIWFEAEDLARRIHPVFDDLLESERVLHTRNVFQVLGNDLQTPSDVVAAFAPKKGNGVTGGTATAFNLARMRGIPTYNLMIDTQRLDFFAFILERMGLSNAGSSFGFRTEDSTSSLSDFLDLD